MKALWIPAAVLAVIITFSLWSGRHVEREIDGWIDALEEVDATAWQEEWQAADLGLRAVYADWTDAQSFLHTVVTHDELEKAESLFAGSFAVCREADSPDFHMLLAQLNAALEHIREAQAVSVRNIF